MDSIVASKKSELKISREALRKRTFERNLSIAIGAGVLGGTAVGQPIAGGLVGGTVYLVSTLFKKRHNN
jgi:hypothetical protein